MHLDRNAKLRNNLGRVKRQLGDIDHQVGDLSAQCHALEGDIEAIHCWVDELIDRATEAAKPAHRP
jgi:hypothetical protein